MKQLDWRYGATKSSDWIGPGVRSRGVQREYPLGQLSIITVGCITDEKEENVREGMRLMMAARSDFI